MNALIRIPLVLGLAAMAALSLLVQAADAQQVCLPHDQAVGQLEKQFGEAVTGRGLTEDGRAMVELLKSAEGTWTLVMTDVHGQSCIIAVGGAWRTLAQPAGAAS